MRLLIIGALNGQIGAASQIAVARGAKVSHVDDIENALTVLRKGHGADLIMADTSLDIALLVSSLSTELINVPVVACGVDDDQMAAVAAIKAGAQEYIPLPPDAELISAVLEAITEEANSIIHADPKMAETIRLAEQIAKSSASILVVGESGTGKELIAHHIHRRSDRSNRPFVAVNCAAIPENLLESELFGYEKGAFTGAIARRVGKFEEANGGTLLLDEISEMDLRLQAKLLRAIQEKEIDRIGGKLPIKVDTRIIATSNREMESEVSNGNFREDLFFRLNVVMIEIPCLADRPGDLEPLANYFVEKYTEANGLSNIKISGEAWTTLKSYNWPGNVRELENIIHRGVLLATKGQILPESLRIETSSAGIKGKNRLDYGHSTDLVGKTVADVERGLIIDTLDHCLGNRTHAANILGISIRTLRNKLKLYSENGFDVPNPGETGHQSSM
ncbi:sigma-54 dependent transcriptional regulator [Gammaproteobacteria bacterium]|nr:sigma-54 dependent transcriptional regulator [Gammaproteobacteria bacterium]